MQHKLLVQKLEWIGKKAFYRNPRHFNLYIFFFVNLKYHLFYLLLLKKMRFTLVFFFLQCTSLLFPQNHVTWSFTYDNVNSIILINGTIDEGWHLYSQKTPDNSGPIPVTVNINKKNAFYSFFLFSTMHFSFDCAKPCSLELYLR